MHQLCVLGSRSRVRHSDDAEQAEQAGQNGTGHQNVPLSRRCAPPLRQRRAEPEAGERQVEVLKVHNVSGWTLDEVAP